MNNKTLKASVLCILISLLTGCFPSGELDRSSETAASGSAPSAAMNDLEHVRFDVALPDEYPSELPIIRCKMRSYDAEELISFFFEGKNITAGEYGNYYTDDGAELYISEDFFRYAVSHRYDGDEEKGLIYDMQYFSSSDATYYYTEYPHYNSELDGFPRSEAIERANELVEKLGLKYLSEPTVFTFTSEDVNKNLVNHIRPSKEDIENSIDISLPKENEFYLVRYLFSYEGITAPLDSMDIFEDVRQAFSRADIILTKDGPVYIDCREWFDEIEVAGTTQIKCTPETALTQLHDYYSAMEQAGTLEEELTFGKIGFAYAAYERNYETGVTTFKPVWCAEGMRAPDDIDFEIRNYRYIEPASGFVLNAGY